MDLIEALSYRKSRGIAALVGGIRRLALDAETQVERQPTRDRPRILSIDAEVLAVVQPFGRRVPRVELEGHAVVEDQLVAELVVLADGPVAIIERGIQVVDPDLEFVIAPEQIRLVIAHDPLGVIPVVVLVPSI